MPNYTEQLLQACYDADFNRVQELVLISNVSVNSEHAFANLDSALQNKFKERIYEIGNDALKFLYESLCKSNIQISFQFVITPLISAVLGMISSKEDKRAAAIKIVELLINKGANCNLNLTISGTYESLNYSNFTYIKHKTTIRPSIIDIFLLTQNIEALYEWLNNKSILEQTAIKLQRGEDELPALQRRNVNVQPHPHFNF